MVEHWENRRIGYWKSEDREKNKIQSDSCGGSKRLKMMRNCRVQRWNVLTKRKWREKQKRRDRFQTLPEKNETKPNKKGEAIIDETAIFEAKKKEEREREREKGPVNEVGKVLQKRRYYHRRRRRNNAKSPRRPWLLRFENLIRFSFKKNLSTLNLFIMESCFSSCGCCKVQINQLSTNYMVSKFLFWKFFFPLKHTQSKFLIFLNNLILKSSLGSGCNHIFSWSSLPFQNFQKFNTNLIKKKDYNPGKKKL